MRALVDDALLLGGAARRSETSWCLGLCHVTVFAAFSHKTHTILSVARIALRSSFNVFFYQRSYGMTSYFSRLVKGALGASGACTHKGM